MNNEIGEEKKEEIIKACEELYKETSFKDITIKGIGKQGNFSRTSIYYYFQTKEEIFLALFTKEYEKWIKDLEDLYSKNRELTKENFAKKIAKTIEKRKNLLKLLSMNMYDMEENSRIEELIKFKTAYGKSVGMVKKCIDKFFKEMTEEEKDNFIFSIFPFMYGIYPYTEVTEKQKLAMQSAKVPFKHLSIYEIAYNGVLKLLK